MVSVMTLLIIGKNSNIYLKNKKMLQSSQEVIEIDRKLVSNFNFRDYDQEKNQIIIFSGVVTEDLKVLRSVEKFHFLLSKKLVSVRRARVLLLSSAAVYGTYKSCFSEVDQCQPITNYGRSKLVIELLYQDTINISLHILRLGNVMGLDSVGKSHIAAKGNLIYLDCREDNSTPLRTYVDMDILYQTILHFTKSYSPIPKILNVGRSQPQSISSAALELDINFELKKTSLEIGDLILKTSLLQKFLSCGW